MDGSIDISAGLLLDEPVGDAAGSGGVALATPLVSGGNGVAEATPPLIGLGKPQWRHPRELGAVDVGSFLTHLAVDRRLAASTQNQACNAIVFLYRHVLADELPADHLGRFVAERSKRPKRVGSGNWALGIGVLGQLMLSVRR